VTELTQSEIAEKLNQAVIEGTARIDTHAAWNKAYEILTKELNIPQDKAEFEADLVLLNATNFWGRVLIIYNVAHDFPPSSYIMWVATKVDYLLCPQQFEMFDLLKTAEEYINKYYSVATQTACEKYCQTSSESGCQQACESFCQSDCEKTCQVGCQVSCEELCKKSCQQTCETVCQTTCKKTCQTKDEAGLPCQTQDEAGAPCKTQEETAKQSIFDQIVKLVADLFQIEEEQARQYVIAGLVVVGLAFILLLVKKV